MEMNRTRYTKGSITQTLSREFRAEMVRKGINVLDMAEAIGVRRASLSNKLNAHTPLNTHEIFALSDELGVRPSEMFARAEQQLAAADTPAGTAPTGTAAPASAPTPAGKQVA